MIFKVIEDEATKSGLRIENNFRNVVSNIHAIFSKMNAPLLSKDNQMMQTIDLSSVVKYKIALQNNIDAEQAFNDCVKNSSAWMKAFIRENDIASMSMLDLAKATRAHYVEVQASNKSWKMLNPLINEFNSGCKTTGLTQQEFIDAISKSNAGLANYLNSLNGAKGSLAGYIGYLAKTTASTMAVRAATVALNMAVSAIASWAISSLISLFRELYVSADELAEKVNQLSTAYRDQQKTLQNTKNTLGEIAPRYQELSKGVDTLSRNVSLSTTEYEEYQQIVSQIADLFPDMVQGYNDEGTAILFCKGNVEELTRAYEEMAIAANNAILAADDEVFSNFNNSKNKFNNRNNALNYSEYDALNAILNSTDIDAAIAQTGSEHLGIAKVLRDNGFKQILTLFESETNPQFIKRCVEENRVLVQQIVGEFEKSIQEEVSKVQNLAEAYLGNALMTRNANGSKLYGNISNSMADVIKNVVGQMDYAFISQFEDEHDMYAYIDSILNAFNDLKVDDRNGLDVFFGVQTKLNNGECSVGDYLAALDNVKSIVSKFDEDTQTKLNVILGLNDNEFEDQYQGLLDKLTEHGMDVVSAENWIKGLNAEQFSKAIKYMEVNTPEFSTGAFNLDELIWQIEAWNKNVENAKKLKFSDLIADTDSDNDFIDQVTSYREAAEDLQGALEKLRAGEEVDLPSLYEQFPELAGADDLEQAIVELLKNKATELGGIFDTYYESLDTSVEGSIPAFDAYRNAVLALFNTAEEGTPIFASLADAMEGVGNASSLIENIQKEMAETGSLSFDTLQSIVKQFGSSAGEYFTISDGKITADIENIKTYYSQAIKDMGLESKELEDALINALNGGFDEAEFGFNALSDAMSKAQSVASVAAAAQKDMTYDQVETMRSLLGKDFEKYIVKDEAGNFKAADVAELREYARELLVTEGASSSLLAEFDSMWETTIAGSKEAETALDRVTQAISNVNSVSEYLTMLQSDDLSFMDALTAATKLLDDMPEKYSLEDFFTFGEDGSIEYHTEFLSNWIGKHIDDMVAAGDVSEDFATKLKEAAQAESTLISYTEKMTEAMTKVQKASNVISTVRQEMAENGAISLGTLQDLYKEFGEDAGDYFTIDSGVITADIDKIKQHYVDLIKDMNLESSELEQALIDALDIGFDESGFNFDALTSAMSKAQNIASVTAETQKELTYDSVESLRDLLGVDFENYINKDAAGNYLSIKTEELKEYARGLLVAENATAGTLAQFDAMWENTIAGSTETTTALDRVSQAISNVSGVSDYLTLLDSDDFDFMDALSSAVKLLEDMPEKYSLENFFTFGDDGSIEYHTEFLTTWLDDYLNKMVTSGDVTQDFANQMKKAAKAESQQVNTLEKLTDAMGDVGKAANLMKDAQEEAAETGSNSLDTILSLYEQFGDKANDMLKITEDGNLVIDTEAIKQEMLRVINEIDGMTPEIRAKMEEALNFQPSETDFYEQVDAHIESVKKLQDALTGLRDNGLSESDLYDLFREFPELTAKTDNLEEAIIDLLNSMNADAVELFAKQFGKVDSEEDRKELQAFMDIVLKLGEVVGNTKFAIDIAAETEGMQHLFDAIKESVSSTGLSAEAIDNLYARYEKLDAFNPAKLFEKTENGIHLNTTALRKLESEYEKFTKQNLDDSLNSLVAEYNSLTEQIDAAGIAAGTTDLYARRNDILNQINETSELAAQYAGLTSAFYKWEQAQSMGEEGDMYDSLAGSLENIKELYDQGLVGTNKFRAAVQLMTNDDLSNASITQLLDVYREGYPLMERYFQDSSAGVENFLNDLQNLNSEWATLNEDGSWDINFGVGNDEEIAEALGINVEAVQAIMRKLSDYGFDINLDSVFTDLNTITTKAEKAAQSLRDMGKTDYSFNVNATNVERLNEQIEEAQRVLAEIKLDPDKEGLEEAKYLLASLIMQKQSLNEPAILKIDTDNVDGEIGEVLRKLSEIYTKYQELEVQAALGADTTQLQAEIDTAIASLSGTNAEIIAALGIDAQSKEAFVSSISDITPEVLVSCGVDASQVEAYQAQEHGASGTVTYLVDDKEVQRYTPKTKFGKVNYLVNFHWDPPTKYGTVYYTVRYRYPDGTTRVNGTAHTSTAYSQGTAYARGDWGSKNSGYALGGELGQELVVRDGKFFTIGDESAEFFQYKKGDIIFNAAQTEEIFAKGKITNAAPRGKAFSSGSGTITGSGSTTTTPSGGGSSGSSNSDDEEDEEEPKIFDWIEVALDRLHRIIDKFATTASSTFKTLRKRLVAAASQIDSVNQELILQEQAHAEYLAQAESVGLPENIAALVRDGTIDINEYDAETAELIEQYQEWYEKALDCADAIHELKENLAALYQERFDAIATDFNNQLDQMEHRISTFGNAFEIKEAHGLLGGASLYSEMQKIEQEKLAKNQEKLASLQSAFADAVYSGTIEVGSEAWYEMQAEINETKEAIQESNLAIIEYGNSIRDLDWSHFDYLQARISQITSETEFLINLLGNEKLYDDHGQFSDAGMAVVGMHGINYNTYMSQADQYAKELLDIEKDLEQNPYDTALIERREELLRLQRESISAAEDEKDAIVDLVKDGIDAELDSLNELIDTYKESLNSAKSLYDYQKKISGQTAEIASLQKQLSAYSGDTSEENRARIQKLQVSLTEAQDKLEESQYEQYIKDQTELLDNIYEDYEAVLNERLDNVDALLADMIDATNGNAETIANTIIQAGRDAGYSISGSLSDILSGDGDMLATYSSEFSSQLTTLNTAVQSIEAYVAAMIRAGDSSAQTTSGKGVVGFSRGGYVAELQKIAMRNGDDMITVNTLKAGEAVLTEKQLGILTAVVDDASYLYKGLSMNKHVGHLSSSPKQTGQSISQQFGDLNIEIDHVEDYNDFVTQLRDDPKFEKMIQSMTTDLLSGKSRLSKYEYQWK